MSITGNGAFIRVLLNAAAISLFATGAIAQGTFPMERLADLGRALDVAQCDGAAVSTWLGTGVDIDVVGKVGGWYQIEMPAFQRVHETLTGRTAIDWHDGMVVMLGGRPRGFYDGMTIANLLREVDGQVTKIVATRGVVEMLIETPFGADFFYTDHSLSVFEFNAVVSSDWYTAYLAPRLADLGGKSTRFVVSESPFPGRFMLAHSPSDAAGAVSMWIQNIEFYNPLYCAVAHGYADIVRMLLDAGADVRPDGPGTQTALHLAAARGRTGVIDEMIAFGVDPELKDKNDETAIFAAVRADRFRSVRCLVRHDVVWNGRNRSGLTPMDVAKDLKVGECVAVLEWRKGFHWSTGLNTNVSSSTESGYGGAPGAGLFFDLHFRLSHRQWVTTEFGYTIRGTAVTGSDALVSDQSGSPYYEYQHMDISPRLNWTIYEGASSRWFAILGGEYRQQLAVDIRTDSGRFEPTDVSDRLNSSGSALTYGLGFSRFTTKGALVGLELRRSSTLSGEWTSVGGGLNSWVLMIRIGS